MENQRMNMKVVDQLRDIYKGDTLRGGVQTYLDNKELCYRQGEFIVSFKNDDLLSLLLVCSGKFPRLAM